MGSLKNRIVWIDYFRAIGLILVISSHIFGTSSPILQLLFGCNVAIMVIASGYCSVRSVDCGIKEYYKKRAKSLILHSWCFFVIYFALMYLITIIQGSRYPYSIAQIVKTFAFLDGIGFTWIIAVFILTAFVTPAIRYVYNRFRLTKWIVPMGYGIIGLVLFAARVDVAIVKAYLYISGYVFLAFVGFALCSEPRTLKYYLCGASIFLLCCVSIIVWQGNDIFDLAANKYPPSVYYIIYGCTVSLILLDSLKKVEAKLSLLHFTRYVSYVSKCSFDIYLWHILGLALVEKVDNRFMAFVSCLCIAMLGAWVNNAIKTAFLKCVKGD